MVGSWNREMRIIIIVPVPFHLVFLHLSAPAGENKVRTMFEQDRKYLPGTAFHLDRSMRVRFNIHSAKS
jgi:hypothetical protein